MKLTFSSAIEAADTERRIIAGVVVPFNEIGNTSVGPVMFERGSIAIHDTAKVKLLLQHQPNAILGRAQSFKTTDQAIYGSFKISASTAGQDALTMCSEDLISGLSVGVDVQKSEPKDGYLLVTAARMFEVSLVETPAFENAQVTRVAASQGETADVPNPTTTETESEAIVENETPAAVTPEVETAPVVEASRSIISASYQVGELRSPIKTHSQYMQHLIAARTGNDDSAAYIRQADAVAKKIEAANDSFTTNPAFNPVAYMPGVIDATVFKDRPTIDACGGARPLPATGMTISHPKITTAGTVAIVAEGGSTTSTQIVSSYVDATVVKLAGQQIMSTELLERSGPSFYDAMYENMVKSYNRAANAAVIAEIVSGGTQASTQAATLAGIQAYVAQAAPAVYAGAKDLATAFIGGTSVWSLLIGGADSTGRNIYSAGNPMNNNGQSTPRTLKGDIMGLDLWVDSGMVATTIDDCAFIVTPSAIAIYESPKLTMSVNVVATGEVNVLLYGYFAVKTLISTGLQRYNLT